MLSLVAKMSTESLNGKPNTSRPPHDRPSANLPFYLMFRLVFVSVKAAQVVLWQWQHQMLRDFLLPDHDDDDEEVDNDGGGGAGFHPSRTTPQKAAERNDNK